MEKRISKHISYKEGVHSNTATRKGIKNVPNETQLASMKTLAKKVFEPLRTHFDEPIRINSFFRSSVLNTRIGGSKTSQHCKGEAVDMDALGGITNKQLFDYIKDNLDFDQLIGEGRESNGDYKWIHVSYTDKRPNRNIVMEADFSSGKVKYKLV